jgi:hypothetical protein
MFSIYNDEAVNATKPWLRCPGPLLVRRLFTDAVSTAEIVRHEIISEDNVREEQAVAHYRGILLRKPKS